MSYRINLIWYDIHCRTPRVISAGWDVASVSSQLQDFEVIAQDRVGLLKDVLDVLEKLEKSALKVEANVANGEARIGLRIEVRHAGEFENAKTAFLEIRGVQAVQPTKTSK